MTKKISLLIIACLLIGTGVLAAGKFIGVISPAQTVLPTIFTPQQSSTPPAGETPWKVEEVARGLFVPWSIVFTSPSRILVTERNGNVRVIENGSLRQSPIYRFPQVKIDQEEGLMGMTLDPEYQSNKYIYLVYAYPHAGSYTDRVVRLTDDGSTLRDEKTLLDGIPAARVHAGSRIKFGPDGKLYITTGDATNKKLPQDTDSLGGKILRINSDGSIPSDNPFPNSAVWSYGHRNPQGIAWTLSGLMLETEHGPSGFDGPLGGDEVNIIEKGKNYGWPVVSHDKHAEGMVDPLLVFTPAIAPAGAVLYTGELFPQWKNNLLFGMLKGEGIERVVFDMQNPKKVVRFEKLTGISVGRVRDVVMSQSGEVYFTTSNEDGRGNARDGDDKIYKLAAQ